MPSHRPRHKTAVVCRMVSTGSNAGRPWPSPALCERSATDLRFIVGRLNTILPAAFPVELYFTNTPLADGWCSPLRRQL